MSRPAQQVPLRPVAAPWSYSCNVTPITSQFFCANRPATTEESTPPDMATTIRGLGASALFMRGAIYMAEPVIKALIHPSRRANSDGAARCGRRLPDCVAAQVSAHQLLVPAVLCHGGGAFDRSLPPLFFGRFSSRELLLRDNQLRFQFCTVTLKISTGFLDIASAGLNTFQDIGHRQPGDSGIPASNPFALHRAVQLADILIQAALHLVQGSQPRFQFFNAEA